MDLSAQFKEYLLSKSDPSSKVTVKNYVSDVNRFIKWFEEKYGQDFSPAEINSTAISTYEKEALSKYSPSSAARNLSSLRKFFNFLKLDGKISHSPFEAEATSRKVEADPWRIKDFKNHLYVFNASHLTIKNYIIDVKQFLSWAEQVLNHPETWEVSENDVFARIDSRLIEEYKARLINEAKLSPVSVNRKLSSLRRYISWAQQEGIIKTAVQVPGSASLKTSNFDDIAAVSAGAVVAAEVVAKPSTYSWFPPLRLLQKGKNGVVSLADGLLIFPLLNAVEAVEQFIWRKQGKPVASQVSRVQALINRSQKTSGSSVKIKNVPKSFYAPALISTKNFPIHKKVWHHVRNTRPNWYRKYQNTSTYTYFRFAIMVLFIAALSYALYSYANPHKKQAPTLAAGLPNAPNRVLSFQGRLTDASDNPITTSTPLRMAIYSSQAASGAALLWQEIVTVTPDNDGIFSTLLGNNTPITQAVFANFKDLWLGVTVQQTAELTPRQQIATVGFATNAEFLQGLPPITNATNSANVILALNSSGNLVIGNSSSPTFQATGGTFTIAGQAVNLSTNLGSAGNIQLAPDGLGKIDLQKPVVNTSINNNVVGAAGSVEVDDSFSVLGTTSASLVTLEQKGTGPLISASVSGTAKFTVDNSGNTNIAGAYSIGGNQVLSSNTLGGGVTASSLTSVGTLTSLTMGGTLAMGANTLTSSGTIGTAATTNFTGLNLTITGALSANGSTGTGLCLTGGATATWASCATGTTTSPFKELSGAIVPLNSTEDFLIGGQATTSAKFAFTGLSNLSNQTQASISGQLVVFPNNGYSGKIGIGTTAPSAYLDSMATTEQIRASYDASNFTSFTTSSGGDLTINPSGSNVLFANNVRLNVGGAAAQAYNFFADGTATVNNPSSDNDLYVQDILEVDGNTFIGDGGSDTFTLDTTNIDISGGAISGATGITSSGTITFSGFTSNGGPLYTNGSGVLAQVTAGTATQCLLGGTTPTFGSCATGGTDSPFTTGSGAIFPLNSTQDFLLGAQATSSALFSFTGVSNLSHQTIASVSGQLIVQPNNGFGGVGIGTNTPLYPLDIVGDVNSSTEYRLAQSIVLAVSGSNTQIGTAASNQAVFFRSGGSSEVARFHTNSAFGLGTAAPISELHVTRALSVGATGKALATFDQIENQDILTASKSGTSVFKIDSSGNIRVAGGTTLDTGSGVGMTSGSIGLGTSNATSVLIGKSGVTTTVSGPLTINNTSTLTIGGALSANASNGTASQCLLGGSTATWGSCAAGGTDSPFTTGSGAIFPLNSTQDFLLGAQATSSALFSFTGVSNLSHQTIASISGKLIVMPNNGFGNVGIGNANPLFRLDITQPTNSYGVRTSDGTVEVGLGIDGSTNGFIGTRSNHNLLFNTNNVEGARLGSNGTFGLGTTAAISQLHVTRALTRAVTGKALVVFDQIENQDIFTASKSGTSKFAVDSSGNLIVAGGTTLDTGSGTGIASGTLGIGTANQTALTLGRSGATTALNGSTITVGGTLAMGSNSLTSSGTIGTAATTNFTGLNITMTGSLSANGSTGSNAQCLLGGATASWGSCGATGTSPFTTGSGAIFPLNSTQDFLIGSQATSSALFSFTGVSNLSHQTKASVSGQLIVMPNNGFGSVGIGTATPIYPLDIYNPGVNTVLNIHADDTMQQLIRGQESSGVSGVFGFNGSDNSWGVILGGNTLGSSNNLTIASGGNVAVGGTTATSLFNVGSSAQFQVNSSGQLVAGSITSGFGSIDTGADNIVTTGTIGSAGNSALTGASLTITAALNANASNGTSSQCLLGGTTATWGSCSTGTITSPFKELSGAIVPLNSTEDFLLGGQATTSAKFTVLNLNSGTPTASISANSGNIATYLSGDGTLSTTNMQPLTIGGSSSGTGNLSLIAGGSGSNGSNLILEGGLGNGAGGNGGSVSIKGGQGGVSGNGGGSVNIEGTKSGTGGIINIGLSSGGHTGTINIGNTSGALALAASNFSLDSNAFDISTAGALSGITTLSMSGVLTNTVSTGTAPFTISSTTKVTNLNADLLDGIDSTGFCQTGGAGCPAGSANYWQLNNGAISPFSNTADVLIGGTSTASAKFAVLNMNTGTPTTSVSGDFVAMPSNGNGRVGIGAAPVISDDALTTINVTASRNLTSALYVQQNATSTGSNGIYSIDQANLGSPSTNNTRVGAIGKSLVTAAAQTGSTLTLDGVRGLSDLSNITLNGTSTIFGRGTLAEAFGSPTINSASGTTLNAIGQTSYVDTTPVLTSVGANSVYNTTAGYFDNFATSGGNANLTSIAYGVQLYSRGNLTTTGNTTHYGAYISASGTADNNYGIYLAGTTGATNNIGLNITSVVAGAGNYALYSDAAAQSYIANNLGLGTSSPISELHVTRPLALGANGKALAIFDQIENQDILTGSQAGTMKFLFDQNGYLSVGARSTTSSIYGTSTQTNTSAWYNFDDYLSVNITSNGSYKNLGFESYVDVAASANDTDVNATGGIMSGSFILSRNTGAGTLSLVRGTNTLLTNLSGTITTAVGSDININSAAGTISTAYGARIGIANSGTLTTAYGLYLDTIAGTTKYGLYQSDTTNLNYFGGKLGVGTAPTSNVGQLYVSRPLASGATGKALGIFDQIENQDILTASKGGTTKFVVDQNGNLGIGGAASSSNYINSTNFIVTTSGAITAPSLTSTGTLTLSGNGSATGITLSGYTTNNSTVLTTNGSGVLSQVTTTTSGQCLLSQASGNLPQWASCPAGAAGTNYWNLGAGFLTPINSTADLLIGGQATTSAKFAVLGLNGTSPTASVSAQNANANAIYLDPANTAIQTVKNQTLNLGGNTTGNIVLQPLASGNVGIGATNPDGLQIALGVTETARGADNLRMGIAAGTPRLIFEDSGSIQQEIDNTAGVLRFFRPGVVEMGIDSTGKVAIGTQTFRGLLNVIGTGNDNAVGIFDQTGTQDIFTASASGTPKFTVDNNGFMSQTFSATGGTARSVSAPSAVTQASAYTGLNIDFSTNITVPNSSSGNQTGILVNLKNGGASATSIGINLTGGMDQDISFQNGEYIDNQTDNTIHLGFGATGGILKVGDSGNSYNVQIFDGSWMGLGSAAGRWNFANAATDTVTLNNAKLRLPNISTAISATSGSLCRENAANNNDVIYNATSNTCVTSSRRFKHNITYVSGFGLDQILNLNPVTFVYNGDDTNTTRLGFIAEDAASVNTLFTSYGADGLTNGLTDYGIEAATVQAIKDLNTKVELNNSTASNRLASLETDLGVNADGDLTIAPDVNYGFVVQHNGQNVSRIGAFASLFVAKFTAGIVNAQQIATNSLSIATDNITIAGQTLSDYIGGIVDQRLANYNGGGASGNQISANIISPLDQSETGKVAVKLNDNNGKSKFEVRNASGSAVASIDSAGNATLSGQLSANSASIAGQLNAGDASISGTLHASHIIADNIDGLDARIGSLSATTIVNNNYYSTPSGVFNPGQNASGSASFNSLFAKTAEFEQGLMSFGASTFFEANVANRLFVGTQLSIADNSINVLGGNLRLQPLGSGGVSFVADQVNIDTDGNLTVNGNATFAKNVAVGGKLYTKIIAPFPDQDLSLELGSGSGQFQVKGASNSGILTINNKGDLNASGAGTFNKLNLSIVPQALAVSDTEVVATGSAGTVTLNANKPEITVDDSLVTANSLIYITPVGQTWGESIYLSRQVAGESFTVGISAPNAHNIKFNFLIIN